MYGTNEKLMRQR